MHPGITAQSLGNWGAATTQDGWRKGPWTSQEDKLLIHYVNLYGEGRWNNVAKLAPGLKRNGKSCRLRWVNYLRPDLKKGRITPKEEKLIVELHAKWGNRWSQIAKYLEGRTDNEIKNYWRTHFKRRTKSPSHDPEKTNSRMFRRQQFPLQLQKQLPQYRGDVENFTSWFNEGSIANEHHTAQETVFPWVASEQAAGCPYPMISNYSNVLSESNGDLLWDDGLWDFDAFFGGKS